MKSRILKRAISAAMVATMAVSGSAISASAIQNTATATENAKSAARRVNTVLENSKSNLKNISSKLTEWGKKANTEESSDKLVSLLMSISDSLINVEKLQNIVIDDVDVINSIGEILTTVQHDVSSLLNLLNSSKNLEDDISDVTSNYVNSLNRDLYNLVIKANEQSEKEIEARKNNNNNNNQNQNLYMTFDPQNQINNVNQGQQNQNQINDAIGKSSSKFISEIGERFDVTVKSYDSNSKTYTVFAKPFSDTNGQLITGVSTNEVNTLLSNNENERFKLLDRFFEFYCNHQYVGARNGMNVNVNGISKSFTVEITGYNSNSKTFTANLQVAGHNIVKIPAGVTIQQIQQLISGDNAILNQFFNYYTRYYNYNQNQNQNQNHINFNNMNQNQNRMNFNNVNQNQNRMNFNNMNQNQNHMNFNNMNQNQNRINNNIQNNNYVGESVKVNKFGYTFKITVVESLAHNSGYAVSIKCISDPDASVSKIYDAKQVAQLFDKNQAIRHNAYQKMLADYQLESNRNIQNINRIVSEFLTNFNKLKTKFKNTAKIDKDNIDEFISSINNMKTDATNTASEISRAKNAAKGNVEKTEISNLENGFNSYQKEFNEFAKKISEIKDLFNKGKMTFNSGLHVALLSYSPAKENTPFQIKASLQIGYHRRRPCFFDLSQNEISDMLKSEDTTRRIYDNTLSKLQDFFKDNKKENIESNIRKFLDAARRVRTAFAFEHENKTGCYKLTGDVMKKLQEIIKSNDIVKDFQDNIDKLDQKMADINHSFEEKMYTSTACFDSLRDINIIFNELKQILQEQQ